jgi:hypothetical protein
VQPLSLPFDLSPVFDFRLPVSAGDHDRFAGAAAADGDATAGGGGGGTSVTAVRAGRVHGVLQVRGTPTALHGH